MVASIAIVAGQPTPAPTGMRTAVTTTPLVACKAQLRVRTNYLRPLSDIPGLCVTQLQG